VLIIVEGPDGAGKTTFIEALTAAMRADDRRTHGRLTTLRKGPPTEHPLYEYERPLLDYLPGVGEHIICDRWHWGESVYPQVLRRSTRFDLAVRRHVEMFLRARGAVVAYLDTPWEVASARVQVRGDDYVHASQVRALKYEYDNVARRSLLSVIKISLDWMQRDGELRRVIEAARYAESHTRSLGVFTTYVGAPRPDVLLLGDVRHEVRPGHTPPVDLDRRWPAFGPFPATSGHYLLTQLRSVRGIGLANACDVDDWRVLHTLLGRPPIVTLGVRATSRVGERRRGSAPHPQYVRRFWHHHGADYRAVIQRASEGEELLRWRPSSSVLT
jgi:thymidylate kinase